MTAFDDRMRARVAYNLARLRVGQVWETGGRCSRVLALPEEIPFGRDEETGEPLTLEVVRTEALPLDPDRPPEIFVAVSCFAYMRLMVDAPAEVPA